MKPSDDLDFGMQRFATSEWNVDDWTADRLLDGRLDPCDAPRELSEIARLVAAANAPATADELAAQDAVVAAMVAAITEPTPAGRTARSHRVAKLLTAKAAAITATTVIGITGAAAATGSLPAPAQSTVASALSYVGVDVPKPSPGPVADAPRTLTPQRPKVRRHKAAPVVTAADTPSTEVDPTVSTVATSKPVGPKPAGTSALGLCTAASVRDDGSIPDSALNSVAFRDLKTAADAVKVDIPTFCKDAKAGQTVTTTATRTATSVDERSTTTTSSTSTSTTSTTVKSDSSTSTTASTTVASTTTSTDNPDATTTSTSTKPRSTARKPTPDTSSTTAATQSQTTDTTAQAG
jgi:hypothetical protein